MCIAWTIMHTIQLSELLETYWEKEQSGVGVNGVEHSLVVECSPSICENLG